MSQDDFRIIVTPERFNEVFSIDDSMHPLDLLPAELYDYMTQFIVGADGAYLSQADARRVFKKIKAKELASWLTKFGQAINEALVPKVNGAASDEQP